MSTKAGYLVLAVGMGQIRPREDPGALRKGEGLLSEMEWVPWCWIFFFTNDERRRQQGVRPRETRLAVEFGHAGSVNYTLGRIHGKPGDKWAVVRMVGAWYQ